MNFKKLTAAITVTALLVCTLSTTAFARKNDWIDGDTPEKFENRVTTSYDLTFSPTIRTNFHAGSIKTLIPTSPRALFDQATGVNVSQYDDAYSLLYVCENDGYGDLAKAAMVRTMNSLGASCITTVTMNLFKYEGKSYKHVINTDQQLEFMISIPKKVRELTRDYAMLRLNADGTVSVLPDIDSDPITVTFTSNYFAVEGLYAFVYGPNGAFDAYKQVAIDPNTGLPAAVNPSTGAAVSTTQYTIK